MNIKDMLKTKIIENISNIRITKTKYRHKYLIPYEVNSNVKELEGVLNSSTLPFDTKEAINFIDGKSDKLEINNSYDKLCIKLV